MNVRWLLLLVCGTAAAFECGCDSQTRDQGSRNDRDSVSPAATHSKVTSTDNSELWPEKSGSPEKLPVRFLPNAYRITNKILSGGLPDGERGFQELAELGVKTVISVDGATPDVELARKRRMRYVHLPHGYDGIPESRVVELAKAVRDLDGQIYIHCHHGKHRSPAAAATACITAGMIRPEDGRAVLKAAGTSENYRGLFQSVNDARPLSDTQLASLNVDYKEVVAVPPLAEAMVALEKTYDRLKLISENNWKVTAKHADLEPAHDALLLQEHFEEMLRTEEVQQKPEEFQSILRDSENASQSLHAALLQAAKAGEGGAFPIEASTSINRVTKNCKFCHQKFRDVPLNEK